MSEKLPPLPEPVEFVQLSRPEDYEDVHIDLMMADAHIHPAFEPRVVLGLPIEQVEEIRRQTVQACIDVCADMANTGKFSASACVQALRALLETPQ